MATPCSCTSNSCRRYVCPNACSTKARITRRVRMPMSLFVTRRAAYSVSPQGQDDFSGPSDRRMRSVNTLTGKVGVDKKHNSYARYLARKVGPVLRRNIQYGQSNSLTGATECGYNCCCYCSQKIDNGNTGMTYIPQIGDTATQAGGVGDGATGIVIAVGFTEPDVDWFTIKANDCNNLFSEGGTITVGVGGFTHQTDIYTVSTVTTCGSGTSLS